MLFYSSASLERRLDTSKASKLYIYEDDGKADKYSPIQMIITRIAIYVVICYVSMKFVDVIRMLKPSDKLD